jgi:hypothetical protein
VTTRSLVICCCLNCGQVVFTLNISVAPDAVHPVDRSLVPVTDAVHPVDRPLVPLKNFLRTFAGTRFLKVSQEVLVLHLKNFLNLEKP